MVWKNTRQVLQTAAAPPSRGSTILATIGSTRNIRPALRKRVLANTGNIVAGCRRGTIRAGEMAHVFIFYCLFLFCCGVFIALIPRVSPRAAGDSLIARNAHACAGRQSLPFLSCYDHVKDLLMSAKDLFISLPRLAKSRGS